MITDRDERLDVLKGAAILLVVVGHVVQSRSPNFDNNIVFKSIYMFHMPLFFFVCGMVYALKPFSLTYQGLIRSVVRRSHRLLVPFLCWYSIQYMFDTSGVSLLTYLFNLYKSPDHGLWFLWVLFVISVLSDIGKFVARFVRISPFLIWILLALVTYHVSIRHHYLGFNLVAIEIPFFIMGVWYKRYGDMFGRLWVIVGTACILLFPIAVHYWSRLHPSQIGLDVQAAYSLPMNWILYTFYLYIGYLYNAIFSIIGIVCFLMVIAIFLKVDVVRTRIVPVLTFIGELTLGIYAIQFYFVGWRFFPNYPVFDGLVATIVATSLSVLLTLMIRRIRPASFLLLGRSPA